MGGGQNAAVAGLRLSQRPKDLYILWAEYEHGVAGVKPEKLFTARERGANKYAFSRRLVFWNMVASLVARGHTSDLAVDKVYAVYGRNQGVTKILQAMQQDRNKRGGHPELRS